MTKEVEEVLTRVARRQGLRSLGRSTFFWTCVFGGVYAVALLGGRLLALWPDWFGGESLWAQWSVLAVPVLGLLTAWALHRGAELGEAARATDVHLDTKDLFLTTLDVDRAPGEYQSLVKQRAAARAGAVRADEVAPLPFGRKTAQVALTLVVLWCATAFLPALDPFGKAEVVEFVNKQREQLVVEEKKTKKRKQALKTKPLDNKNSTEVQKALEEVVSTFKKMERRNRSENDKKLRKAQQTVGAQWRKARAKSQRQGSSSPKVQSLGKMMDSAKTAEWRKDLAQGKSDSLRRELQELRDALKKMAGEGDEKKREELRKQLQQRTKNLADFLKNNATSREMNETLSKALNQLQALATPKLAEKAMKALNQTLELSEMELKNLAQSLRDMKSLENALKALQAARKANSKGCSDCKGGGKDGKGDGKKDGKGEGKGEGQGDGKGEGEGDGQKGLDGGMTPQLEGMREYEEYYQKMLEELEQKEPGEGMKGGGTGEGNVAPENPNSKNKFKTEKALSALKAGKILMTLKTKEVGDKGVVQKNYAEQIEQVKQGVGEAILQERVPPGYHEGIKRYFDNLGKNGAKKGKKK